MTEILERDELKALLESFREGQDLLQSLFNFLRLKKWKGVAEQLAESLPHFSHTFGLKDLKVTLSDIGYNLHELRLKRRKLDERLLPVIYIDQDNKAVVIDKDEGKYVQINEFGDKQVIDWPYLFTGTICVIHEKPEKEAKQSWFRQIFLSSRVEFGLLVTLSIVANIMILMTPLYVMFVYDKVLKAHSLTMLWSFMTGMLIVLVSYWFVQRSRRKIVADLCANSVKSVDDNILSKILRLPSSFTEVSSISSQITRVQDYEGINEAFAKGILPSMIDVPFYLVFIAVFYLIGGALVLVPLVGLALFAVLIAGRSLWDRYVAENELRVDTTWRSFLIESLQKVHSIRGAHFEKPWMKRFSHRTAIMVQDRYREAYRQSVYEVIGESLLLVVVLMLLGVGVVLITEKQMSVGGLIAGMILIWQVMSPVKLFAGKVRQYSGFKNTLRQIERIGNIEQEDYAPLGEVPRLKGAIEFTQVGLRYTNERDPALIGFSLKIKPGELVVITGPNGAGKSSIFKLLLRMYQQQVGTVTIDEQDIRQLPHNHIRRSIAYAPQNPQFFYGTILQNLKLSNSLASLQKIIEACRQASVLEDIKQLPKGFETRIRDSEIEQLPASFKQRLQLARILLSDAPIIILDEPASHLDMEHDKKFIELLTTLKGKKTVLMSSHRPSHLALADQAIYMEKGQIKSIEKPNQQAESTERVSNA